MNATESSEYPTGEGIALTHGAGSDRDSPLLLALDQAFTEAGITVLRFNLAYRERRPKGPPHPSTAQKDRDSIREALTALRQQVPGPLYAAGHSYGGRQLSMLAAEDPTIATALILFAYPLAAPGHARDTETRSRHFPQIQIPTLFVHGPKDPFATPDELAQAVHLIPAPHEIYSVPKAAHSLNNGRFPLAPLLTFLRRGPER